MKLITIIEMYIDSKRALGMSFKSESRILRSFCTSVGDVHIAEVSPADVRRFLDETSWRKRYSAIRGLFKFASARSYALDTPLPPFIPKQSDDFVPHIYTSEEMRSLLESAHIVCASASCVMEAQCFRTLLAVLWGSGIRVGEALRLTLSDVNTSEDLLTIRDTKFHKSRLVPIAQELTTLLHEYLQNRVRLGTQFGQDSLFFCAKNGDALSVGLVGSYFSRLRKFIGMGRRDDCHIYPRLHDLRHTFAVIRVEAWYQAGANVQDLLPHLSTYLGHISLSCTQRYLTSTPEILKQSCILFERYALEAENDRP